MAFTIYISGVEITEGGIIGLMLLIEHWLGIPSAVITPVLDIICYAMAFRLFGESS